jgi:hypothetical protein
MPRDSYNGGQGYNNNQSNGNTNSWGMNSNANHQQQGAGYYEHHVPVNGFDTKEAMDLLTRGMSVLFVGVFIPFEILFSKLHLHAPLLYFPSMRRLFISHISLRGTSGISSSLATTATTC